MEDIQSYRHAVIQALLASANAKGGPELTEAEAMKLASHLNDEQLAEGMDYNTPEEVAELLLDAGLIS